MQVVQEFQGPFLRVEGIEKPLLNMANFDFLGMGQRKELKEAAVQALDKVSESKRRMAENNTRAITPCPVCVSLECGVTTQNDKPRRIPME